MVGEGGEGGGEELEGWQGFERGREIWGGRGGLCWRMRAAMQRGMQMGVRWVRSCGCWMLSVRWCEEALLRRQHSVHFGFGTSAVSGEWHACLSCCSR